MKLFLFIVIIILLKCELIENKIFKDGLAEVFLSNSFTFSYKKIENLIVFGGSHSDINTNYTDMTYTGVNHSGGKNWPLQLKDLHNFTLWNYSKGGSLIDLKLLDDLKLLNGCKWCKYDLKKQYSYFYENTFNNKNFYYKWNSNNSLFAIFIGHNDIKIVRRENIEMDISSIVNGLFNIIEDMYDVGARNILIFELLPVYRGPAKETFYKKVKKEDVLMFNNYIKINAKKLFKKKSNANIIIYNTLERAENIIDNCYMFGFKDCTHAYRMNMKNRTKNISDYFWNDSHLTEKGNKILTNDIDDILSSIN